MTRIPPTAISQATASHFCSRSGTGTGDATRTGTSDATRNRAGTSTSTDTVIGTGVTKGIGAALNAQERKLVRRLLRLALDGPLTVTTTGDARPVIESGGRTLSDIDPALLRRLVADGLLAAVPQGFAATAETASFLRRAITDAASEPFLDQHRVLETVTLKEADSRRSVRRNLAESPLFPLLRLKDRQGLPFLSDVAVQAGERLAEDFERAGLQPRITASWEPRLASRTRGQAATTANLADVAQSARRRLASAITAMGPELSGVALDVCCFGKGLETVERERQWPARSAKLMLRAALLALARHYAPPPRQGQRLPRHWGEEGYRPEIG